MVRCPPHSRCRSPLADEHGITISPPRSLASELLPRATEWFRARRVRAQGRSHRRTPSDPRPRQPVRQPRPSAGQNQSQHGGRRHQRAQDAGGQRQHNQPGEWMQSPHNLYWPAHPGHALESKCQLRMCRRKRTTIGRTRDPNLPNHGKNMEMRAARLLRRRAFGRVAAIGLC